MSEDLDHFYDKFQIVKEGEGGGVEDYPWGTCQRC